jgi:hypothetical protein
MGRMDLGDSLAQNFIILVEISVGIAACQLQVLWNSAAPPPNLAIRMFGSTTQLMIIHIMLMRAPHACTPYKTHPVRFRDSTRASYAH